MPPSCGFVRCPQKPPPSLRSTPRQLAPQVLAVSAERLRPGGQSSTKKVLSWHRTNVYGGHVWKVWSATSPFHPLQSNASHDDVIDAFKLCINNLRVIFEPLRCIMARGWHCPVMALHLRYQFHTKCVSNAVLRSCMCG